MKKCYAAYTQTSNYNYYPPYINISEADSTQITTSPEENKENLIITIRDKEIPVGESLFSGNTSSIVISKENFEKLIEDYYKERDTK